MSLERDLNSLFGRKRKSYLVAVYPDGRQFEIRMQGGAYYWANGCGSYPLSAARENVERLGGKVERRYR